MKFTLPDLPICSHVEEIRDTMRRNGRVVIESPPGSGKTTIIPLLLVDEDWLAGKKILILQPRRLAVRSVAARIAELIGEEVGATVGYRIRFDACVSRATRIEVLTEGLLTRRMQDDPELSGVGCVIFDEFHERSLHADLSLALLREVSETLRPDLKIIVMSATMGEMPVCDYLGAERLGFSGRVFPVSCEYGSSVPPSELPRQVFREIRRSEHERPGDVLVFLPGIAEIQQVERLLNEGAAGEGAIVYSLYGDLPYERQRLAILPDRGGRRKVILSTPIAETSITIEGVGTVIDSGLARFARFDAASGLERLVTERISRDAADQRAGRAGRTGPGHCVRLWSAEEHGGLRQSRTPEIMQADLCSFVLEMAMWGVKDSSNFAMLSAPPESSLSYARDVLTNLQAINGDGSITERGRLLAKFGTHPRIASMFLAACRWKLTEEACNLAAILEERDIMRWAEERSADVELRLALFTERSRDRNVDAGLLARVRKAAQGWQRRIKSFAGLPDGSEAGRDVLESAAGFLLAHAYPERIARRRANSTSDEARYLLEQGKGGWLRRGDPLGKSEFLVVASMKETGGDSPIMLAAPLNPRLFDRELKHLTAEQEIVGWDEESSRVKAVLRRSCGAVLISEKPLTEVDPERIQNALMEGLKNTGGLARLNWIESCRELQARVRILRRYCPELGLPSLEDSDLETSVDEWLRPYIENARSLADLERIDLYSLLTNILGWQNQKILAEYLPDGIDLPAGRRRRINYLEGEYPVLEATVQELFGWRESPKLGNGRVPLKFHILSPARRPIQVTLDLSGFWKDGYPQVRKELRGRYPKHKWPEDPLSAMPPNGGQNRR